MEFNEASTRRSWLAAASGGWRCCCASDVKWTWRMKDKMKPKLQIEGLKMSSPVLHPQRRSPQMVQYEITGFFFHTTASKPHR